VHADGGLAHLADGGPCAHLADGGHAHLADGGPCAHADGGLAHTLLMAVLAHTLIAVLRTPC